MSQGMKAFCVAMLLASVVAVSGTGAIYYLEQFYLHPPSPGGRNSQNEHQPTPSNEHAESKKGIRDAPTAPLIVEMQHTQGENEIGPQSEEEGRWYANPDWWVAGFTGLLFIATAGLWIFTGLLWRTTRTAVADGENAIKAANDAVSAANRHANESARLAAAAEQANLVGQKNLAAGQRAWLRPLIKISGPLRYIHKGDLEIEFSILVENVGKSPATKVYIVPHLIVRSDGSLEDIPEIQKNYSDWAKWRSGAFTEGIVFPGDKPEHVLRMRIHYSEMEKIANNFQILFIGCIDYEIPFSADHHQTWFSGEVRTRMRPFMWIHRRDGDTPADDLILVGILGAIHHAD